MIPLYLYQAGLSFTLTGMLVSIKEVLKIVANYLGKLMLAKKHDKPSLIVATFAISVPILAIIFLKNIYVIFALTLLSTFGAQFMFVIVFGQFVQSQKELGIFQDQVFYRDVFQNSARTFMSSLYLLLPIFPAIFGIGLLFTSNIGFCSIKATKNKSVDLIQNVETTTQNS